MRILILFNEPVLPLDDPDAASEAGVLESVEAVEFALQARGHETVRMGLPCEPARAVEAVQTIDAVDVVFNLFEGFGGIGRGEAEIAGLIELGGVPLTGSPPACLALVRDKVRSKYLLAGAGIPTPEFLLVADGQPLDRMALESLVGRGPVIVKPAHEDASLGIGPESVVESLPALERQIDIVRTRYGDTLAERYIAGREFNVSVLALPVPQVLPLAEIVFGPVFPPDRQIVTYAAKWDADSEACRQTPVQCPAEVRPELAAEIRRVALAAFRLAGCRDYARVDLRVDRQGRVFVIEINGNPDIGPTAGLARALGVAGIEYDRFVEQVVWNAERRKGP